MRARGRIEFHEALRELELEAATVDEAIDRLDERWPGMRDRLVEPGRQRQRGDHGQRAAPERAEQGAAGDGAQDHGRIAVAQVADAEHAALDLAQARAQRAVKALVNHAAHRIGIHPLRHHDEIGRAHV